MIVAQITTDNREPFRQYDQPEPWFGAAPAALFQGLAAIAGVEVHVLSCTQKPMPSSPERLADNIRFHSLHVPKIGWLRTGYQGCARAVRKKLLELKPDIVHGQGTERECAISAVSSGVPNVVTIHGNMAELARQFGARFLGYGWLAARLEDFTLPRSAGVFCNSAYTEALVRPRAKQVWRVANAIRRKFLDLPFPAGSKSRPTIVSVGVVSERKRQLETLALAADLHRDGADVEFEFIGHCEGHTEYEREFRERIAIAEKLGYARWLGTMGASQIIARFDCARALLHFPSEEAFGLVVAEALARNLKFFGSRVGGIVDISEGVEFAELFKAGDWQALAAGIRSWLAAGAPQPTSAAAAMKARYDPFLIARQHIEIYREVLSTSS